MVHTTLKLRSFVVSLVVQVRAKGTVEHTEKDACKLLTCMDSMSCSCIG